MKLDFSDWKFIFIVFLVVVNLIVSIYIFVKDDLENFQKNIQIVLIWVIPLLGAVIIWLVNRSFNPPKKITTNDNLQGSSVYDNGSSGAGGDSGGDSGGSH